MKSRKKNGRHKVKRVTAIVKWHHLLDVLSTKDVNKLIYIALLMLVVLSQLFPTKYRVKLQVTRKKFKHSDWLYSLL